jgi:hypothetical protein
MSLSSDHLNRPEFFALSAESTPMMDSTKGEKKRKPTTISMNSARGDGDKKEQKEIVIMTTQDQ